MGSIPSPPIPKSLSLKYTIADPEEEPGLDEVPDDEAGKPPKRREGIDLDSITYPCGSGRARCCNVIALLLQRRAQRQTHHVFCLQRAEIQPVAIFARGRDR